MSRVEPDDQGGPRRSAAKHVYYGPVLCIGLLLVCWFLIVDWQDLPQVIGSTMAAIP